MPHPLRVHIESVCKLTDEEFEYIITHFTLVKHKKHSPLIREGDLVKHEYFVLKGCLRSYITDAITGKEFTYSFAAENWWVSEREAFTKKGYWIAAPHLSFPGIGHLKFVNNCYEWLPANYKSIF